jgi:hypothetical protein
METARSGSHLPVARRANRVRDQRFGGARLLQGLAPRAHEGAGRRPRTGSRSLPLNAVPAGAHFAAVVAQLEGLAEQDSDVPVTVLHAKRAEEVPQSSTVATTSRLHGLFVVRGSGFTASPFGRFTTLVLSPAAPWAVPFAH